VSSVYTGPTVNLTSGFAIRWLLCALLVFGAYNPTGYSYYHWIIGPNDGLVALKAFTGILLLTGDIALVRMMMVSVGYQGTAAIFSVVAVFLFAAVEFGLVERTGLLLNGYWILFILVTVLAVGLIWSHLQLRITGERDKLQYPP
jgi:hypothetical protein